MGPSRLLAPGALALAVAAVAVDSHAGFVTPVFVPPPLIRREANASLPGATLPSPAEAAPGQAPAIQYASLAPGACEAELTARGVAHASLAPSEAPGVLAPIKLLGDLHGVIFHLAGSRVPARPGGGGAASSQSVWEIVDCRLALALDDFAEQLARRGIVEVVHFSMYRPPPRRWAEGRIGSRHLGGLAIDIASFVKDSGDTLVVERDFHGRIGAKTCGPGTGPSPATAAAKELRQIACEAAERGFFNVELTPDFNWAHRNHFHLEVTRGVGWFYVH